MAFRRGLDDAYVAAQQQEELSGVFTLREDLRILRMVRGVRRRQYLVELLAGKRGKGRNISDQGSVERRLRHQVQGSASVSQPF